MRPPLPESPSSPVPESPLPDEPSSEEPLSSVPPAVVVSSPDPLLKETEHVVVSADAEVLDGCGAWFNLARIVVEQHVPDAGLCDLSDPS